MAQQTDNRVVGYARASTASQEITVDAQGERIKSYCKTYDLELVALINDPAASAKDLRSRRKRKATDNFLDLVREHRPRLADALGYLDEGKAGGLVVAKLDRLTRSVRDLGDIIDHYFEVDRFSLLSVGDQIDTRTATGRFVLNLLGSVAQWERETIVERTKAALAHKRLMKEYCGGRVPYGWRLIPDDHQKGCEKSGCPGCHHITPDPIEQGMIRIARGMRQDMSLRSIGTALDNSGFKAKGGGPWHAKTVQDLIEGELAPDGSYAR
jgi:DNA invertase Pin-like site-specific DNA recombinase